VTARAGETVAQLARRADTTPAALVALNPALANLAPGAALPVGLLVRVPSEGADGGAAPGTDPRERGGARAGERSRPRGGRDGLGSTEGGPATSTAQPRSRPAAHGAVEGLPGVTAGVAVDRPSTPASEAPRVNGPRVPVVIPWIPPAPGSDRATAQQRSGGGGAMAVAVLAGSVLLAAALGLKGLGGLEVVLGAVLGGLLGGLGQAISASCARPPASTDRRDPAGPGPGGAR
jgi:hypothetical protein